MKKDEYNNYVIVTGVLLSKNRNANTISIKRPVLDLELMFINEEHELLFGQIPIVVPDVSTAKLVAGIKIGDVLTISGAIRNDKIEGMYIEAFEFSKRHYSGNINLTAGRASLLQDSHRFNIVFLYGQIIEKNQTSVRIKTHRQYGSVGDLTTEDIITIQLSEKQLQELQPKDNIYLVGEFCDDYTKTCIIANTIKIIQSLEE